jgi:hypothetical protein
MNPPFLMEPRLKRCRACGACSEKMDKCPTCRDRFQLKWSALAHLFSSPDLIFGSAFHDCTLFSTKLFACFLCFLEIFIMLFGIDQHRNIKVDQPFYTRQLLFNYFSFAGITAAKHAKFLTGRTTKNTTSRSRRTGISRAVSMKMEGPRLQERQKTVTA